MGGGLEADLTEGGVPALWSSPRAATGLPLPALRPVLQVADLSYAPDGTVLRPEPLRYSLLLSDGVHSQRAWLDHTLDHLALRRGSVVRLLFDRVRGADNIRTIFIVELEILQTECALIGNPKRYKPPRRLGSAGRRVQQQHGAHGSR